MKKEEYLFSDKKRHDFVIQHIKEPIIEIGCDTGKSTKILEKLGYLVERTDIYPERATLIDPKTIKKHNIETTKLEQKDYNTILLLDVIEHLQHQNKALENIHEALNKEGKLIVTTPNILHFKNRIKMLIGNGKEFDPANENPHIRFYTPSTLKETMEKAGFKEIKSMKKGSITAIYQKVEK